MTRYHFKQDPATRNRANKRFTCTADGVHFTIKTIASRAGRTFYIGSPTGSDSPIVSGVGRDEIEASIGAALETIKSQTREELA
jgi:hypothetical protein